jgi:hypothetical protein
MRIWGHRFVIVGTLCSAIGAWMLVRKPAKAGNVWLATGLTMQFIGAFLQH